MKVAALLPDYLDKPMGGLGVQFMNMYAHLKDRMDYYIVGYPENPKVKYFKSNLTPFKSFEYPTINNIYHQLLYYHNMLEYKVEFDVIHCFDWSTALAGVFLSRHFNKPLVYGMNLSSRGLNHTGTFFSPDMNTNDGHHLNYFNLVVEDFGLEYANRIVHVSKYYADVFSMYRKKSVIIRNGLNLAEWTPKRVPNLPGKNKIKVCFIGRACIMKGIDMITNCNIPDNVDFYFVAARKGAEPGPWEQIEKKINNKNIFHIKGLFGQDKIDFLYAMDAVVMPSIHEPAGIVAMEALISKNVFITTAIGGIAETVEGVDYFECHNSKELQECLEKLTTLNDKDLNTIKRSGYQKMLECDWSKSADQLYNLYEEVQWEPAIPCQARTLEQTIKDIEDFNNSEKGFFVSH